MFDFFDRNSDKTPAFWDIVDQDQIDGELLEQAEHRVKCFLGVLEQGITTRKKTIAMLEDLASELDKTDKNVNIAKVTGTLTAAVGCTVPDLDFHDSSASPPDGVMKMEDAQKILDKDKETLEGIDECYSNLVRTAKKISASNPKYGTKEHVLCSVLLGSKLKGGGKNNKGLGLWGLL